MVMHLLLNVTARFWLELYRHIVEADHPSNVPRSPSSTKVPIAALRPLQLTRLSDNGVFAVGDFPGAAAASLDSLDDLH